jgi:hypothetical protein
MVRAMHTTAGDTIQRAIESSGKLPGTLRRWGHTRPIATTFRRLICAATTKDITERRRWWLAAFRPTMFFLDPAENALEFKAFADMGQIFAK